MKVRSFVASSGLVLACWLTVTFLRPVSEKDYPLLGKGSVPATAQAVHEVEADADEPELVVAMGATVPLAPSKQ